jgi:hypothetical protein
VAPPVQAAQAPAEAPAEPVEDNGLEPDPPEAVVDGVGARALRTAAAERPAFSRWEAAHHLTVMTNAASITIDSLSQP